jgi:GDP-mannose 6-dehydrogenase
VGLFGLAFKDGTDDLRESPLLELAERLLGRGYELLIHDPQVLTARLQGANREYVVARIPHLERLLAPSPQAVVAHGQTLVVGAASPPVVEALEAVEGRVVIDLVRLPDPLPADVQGYEGIAW